MRLRMRFFVALMLSTGISMAATFSVGDVFASISSGNVQQYSSAGAAGALLTTGAGGFTTGSTFDSSGNFYVTNFSGASVYKFLNGGSNTGSLWASLAPTGALSSESILFNLAGDALVGNADGDADVVKLGCTGVGCSGSTLLGEFNVAIESRGSDWIDLAADQTTLFYTSEGRLIKRFDLATNTQLADFATLAGPRGPNVAFALRLLSDGGLLVADRSNVKRLNAAGVEIQSYDVAGEDTWFSLNLDPNGTSFWSGNSSSGNLYKFNIATGALEQTISTGAAGLLFGVSVFGEICAGCGSVNPVPEPAHYLGIGLGVLALAIWRRRAAAATAK